MKSKNETLPRQVSGTHKQYSGYLRRRRFGAPRGARGTALALLALEAVADRARAHLLQATATQHYPLRYTTTLL